MPSPLLWPLTVPPLPPCSALSAACGGTVALLSPSPSPALPPRLVVAVSIAGFPPCTSLALSPLPALFLLPPCHRDLYAIPHRPPPPLMFFPCPPSKTCHLRWRLCHWRPYLRSMSSPCCPLPHPPRCAARLMSRNYPPPPLSARPLSVLCTTNGACKCEVFAGVEFSTMQKYL